MQERHSELLEPVQVVHCELHDAHLLLEISLKVPEGQSETHVEADPFKKRLPLHVRHYEAEAPEQVRQLGLQLRHEGVGLEDAN